MVPAICEMYVETNKLRKQAKFTEMKDFSQNRETSVYDQHK